MFREFGYILGFKDLRGKKLTLKWNVYLVFENVRGKRKIVEIIAAEV